MIHASWSVTSVTSRTEYGTGTYPTLYRSFIETPCGTITLLLPINLADPAPRTVAVSSIRRKHAILVGEVTCVDATTVTVVCHGMTQTIPRFACSVGDTCFVEAVFGSLILNPSFSPEKKISW